MMIVKDLIEELQKYGEETIVLLDTQIGRAIEARSTSPVIAGFQGPHVHIMANVDPAMANSVIISSKPAKA